MNITLISPYSSLAALGLRTISACLKRAGHNVKMVFLTASPHSPLSNYSRKLLDGLVALCSDSKLIGISLMSGNFEQAVQITNAIKEKIRVPIIWGGIHPTSMPDESLQYADIVCIGEGEDAIIELAHNMDSGGNYYDTENLCLKLNGGVKKNAIRPLIQNIDSMPFMDYDINGHYIYHEGDSLVPMTKELLREHLILEETLIPGTAAYQTIWARGCPYKCTYCCNDIYHTLYKGQKLVRKKSAKRIIEEIKNIKNNLDFITNIWFHDDSFFAISKEDLTEFSMLYKKEIGMPFCALGDPIFTSEEKLSMLADAGLHTLSVGIESGSETTIALYNRRHFKPEKTIRLGEIINKFTDKIRIRYDIIVDNPYETNNDVLDTIKMLIKIPYPYMLQIFSLTFFPGTELYRKAKKDGLLRDEAEGIHKKHYFKIKPTYLNLILKLFSVNFSKSVIKFMISPPMLFIFNREWPARLVFRASKITWLILKKIKNFLTPPKKS